MDVRNAQTSEIRSLAKLWHNAWQDAHSEIVPDGLVRIRTPEDFEKRTHDRSSNMRVVGPVNAPLGFYVVDKDELEHLFVSSEARGTGIAQLLIEDAERSILNNGFGKAWLGCVIGNKRAARFYEKCGWHLERVSNYEAVTSEGTFKLDVWRYEKILVSNNKVDTTNAGTLTGNL